MNDKKFEEMAIVSRLVGYSASLHNSELAAINQVSTMLPSKYNRSLENFKSLLFGDNQVDKSNFGSGPYIVVSQLIDAVKHAKGDSSKLLISIQSSIKSASVQVLEYWTGFRSLISYLLAVLAVACIIFSIYSYKILPSFLTAFDSFGAQLPKFTQLFLLNGKTFNVFLGGLIVLGACIFVLYRYLDRRIKSLQSVRNELRLIPGFEALIQCYTYFLFVNFYAALVNARIEPNVAIDTATKVAGLNTEKCSNFTAWYDALVCAEKLGALEAELGFQCEQIGPVFSAQMVKSRQTLTLASQAIIGTLIGALLMAMYLPIFSLGAVI